LQHIINSIIQKLKEPLPGEEAQHLMAPVGRGKAVDYGDQDLFRKSAVMVLLCEDESGEVFIPLTQRFAYDGVHSGQVSFPGGKFDEQDETLQQTALRECEEEIGVTAVKVLGMMTSLYIPVSNFLVQPVVGYCAEKNVFMTPNVREVKHIVKLYLKDLLNETITKEGDVEVARGLKRKAPYFEIEGLKVWGATAMILSEFKVLLKTIF
jgi:8-oxo-dGTP pyrophosphatase MutT (NUDIX family)